MGRGDFGFDGLYSLGAINSWIAVINSNLNATSRTGYKANKVKFRGGVSEVVRNPNGPVLGIQLPESTLQIDQSSIDFSQGSIVASTEPTHLAIQGKGFFRLATLSPAAGNGAAVAPAGSIAYYSRDGEFHVVNDSGVLRLVHSTGLYLVDSQGRGANLDVVNGLVVVGGTAFGAVGVRVYDERDVFNTATPNFLRFSRYGSTVFESTRDSIMVNLNPGDARVIGQSLESSNSSLSQTLPELSLAQKFFSAVSKIISVHQTNLDTVINLVR
jgi:flagellar basal body rod protein FlgG